MYNSRFKMQCFFRFPELPVSSQSSTHWLTAHIFPLFYETGPREPGEATGPLPCT